MALRDGALLLVLAAVTLASCGTKPEEAAAPATAPAGTIQERSGGPSVTTDVNARSPAFARTDFAGTLVRTQDAIGRKALLLDFWSVFCQSCLQEMPFLRGLHERYAAQGLEIVGVNTDFFPKERIESFMRKTGLVLPYPLIHDRDQSLSKLFSIEALPVLVLIDSEGWIRMVHLGYRPDDEGEIERRVRKACGGIRETIVTLQPVGGATAFSPPDAARMIAAPGTPVGEFVAVDAAGGEVSFARWRGGAPAVVFFWSVFCQPCREEFGPLSDLAAHPPAPGLQVLAVNVDAAKLRPQAARLFSGRAGRITGVFDPERSDGRHEIADRFGVSATPSTFLVGSEGTVLAAWSGEVDARVLGAEIGRLLAPGAAREASR
ncbi:MAG TPA: TlpA disulfide reductase family protein [Candidatus Methanoperedens sp.]|nr:TlpA disulfide reductase family protein [Candidatus Methanoperedens sp.]